MGQGQNLKQQFGRKMSGPRTKEDLMNQSQASLIVGGIVVAALVVGLIVTITGKKQNRAVVKQGWIGRPESQANGTWGIRGASIDMGSYPPSTDPTYWSRYAMNWPFKPSDTISDGQSENLVKKWYTFEATVDPNISATFYTLLPDLQTLQSVQSYGLTQRMVDAVHTISSYLDNPDQFKTTEDVYRLIGPTAIQIFNRQTNQRSHSGLYNDVKGYGWGINVL